MLKPKACLASAYKDLWEYSTDQDSKKKYAELAIARYGKDFSLTASIILEQVNARNWRHNIIPVLIFLLCISSPMKYETAKEYAEKAKRFVKS